MSAYVVIPARLASSRLPDKPLADIAGVPMIVRVAQQASRARVDGVYVAVDHTSVFDVVHAAGYHAVMTRLDHRSGSDRVMEVARTCGWAQDDIVINVQGDEPLIPPRVIEFLAEGMNDPGVAMATLAEPIDDLQTFENPNVVKVVTDAVGNALYFSRSPVPYPRDAGLRGLQPEDFGGIAPKRHIGIYAFRVSALEKFVSLTDSRLEGIEQLEQLRWLEAGEKLLVLDTPEPVPGGVDTPEDLDTVIQAIDSAGL